MYSFKNKMAVNIFLVICVQTLLIQSALSRCLTAVEPTCTLPFIPAASSGGSFVVTSSSPIAPTGVSVVSENLFEGALIVGGNLPMLGSVGVEGDLLNAGAGAVSYGCGDDITVVDEGPLVTGILMPVAVTPISIGNGFGAGFYPYFGGYGYDFGYPGYGYYGYGYC